MRLRGQLRLDNYNRHGEQIGWTEYDENGRVVAWVGLALDDDDHPLPPEQQEGSDE